MASREDDSLVFRLEEGKVQTLQYFGNIGAGSIGTVIKVKGMGTSVLALKYSTNPVNEAMFNANADSIIEKAAPFSVPIIAKGTVDINGESRAALLMPYAGNNLAQVMSHMAGLTKKIDDNVKEAFSYKVALHVLHTLELYSRVGLNHGDLQPGNILTDVDLNQFSDIVTDEQRHSFESRLLEGQTLLCDRMAIRNNNPFAQNLSSLLFASAYQGNYLKYFDLDALGRNDINRDMKAATRLLQELLCDYLQNATYSSDNIRNKMDVVNFGRTFLNVFNQAADGSNTYPTAEILRLKVEKLADETKYFIREVKDTGNGVKTQFVLRPVDKFFQAYAGKRLADERALEGLLTSGNFSLRSMLARGGTKLKSDEKARMYKIFTDVITTSVDLLHTEMSTRINGRQPIVTSIGEIKKDIDVIELELQGMEREVQGLAQEYGKVGKRVADNAEKGIVDSTLFAEAQSTGAKLMQARKNVDLCKGKIEDDKSGIAGLEKRLEEYNCASQESTLRYIRDSCLVEVQDKGIRDQLAAKISEKIS